VRAASSGGGRELRQPPVASSAGRGGVDRGVNQIIDIYFTLAK
jgi:hypothetical protein